MTSPTARSSSSAPGTWGSSTSWSPRSGSRARRSTSAIRELIPALRGHPHIGWLLVHSAEHGAVVLGPAGERHLETGRVEGEDPLAAFSPTAATHLLRTDGFEHVADLMIGSFYDPVLDEGCAFEELISFHGGLGGPQTQPFILYPPGLPDPTEPILGAAAVHALLVGLAGHAAGGCRRRPGRPYSAAVTASSLDVRYAAGVAALAGAYYGAAKLGYELEFSGPVAAIVWLPAGVGAAFLSLGGLRFWPGVLIGDLLANDYSVLPLGSALGQTVGNMAEVLVAAVLIRRLVARGSPLDSLGGIVRLLLTIAARDGDQRHHRPALAPGR